MLLRQRQSHRLRQRTLLMLALLACNPTMAEGDSPSLSLSAPSNSLRSDRESQGTVRKSDARTSAESLTKGKDSVNTKPQTSKPHDQAGPIFAAQIVTIPLFPLSQAEMVTPTPVPLIAPAPHRFSPDAMQLVSDGWNARKAMDVKAPLVDPTAPAPTYAKPTTGKTPSAAPTIIASPTDKSTATNPLNDTKLAKPADAVKATAPVASTPVLLAPATTGPSLNAASPTSGDQNAAPEDAPADWTREPKSTLKFIIPQPESNPNSFSQDSSKTTADDSSSQGTPASEMPEPLDRKPLNENAAAPPTKTPSIEAPSGSSNSTERVTDPESVDETIVNPEQNEPEGSGEPSDAEADESSESIDGERQSNVEDMPLEEMGSDLDELSNDAEAIEELPPADTSKPNRLEVRELKLDTDGELSEEQTPDAEMADDDEQNRDEPEPTAKPSNRQSVGDDLTPLKPANIRVALNVDRVGPKGDLILAIGMDTQRYPLTAQASRLRVPIERTLNHYWNKPEDAEERTHWGMFHNVMIYDKDTPIIANRRKFNAVAWMAGNNACRNQLLFEEDSRGINVKSGVGLQGHQAQLLAVFGLIDVPAAYPLYVGRNRYSVQDVVKREMLACQSGAELTFTLIGMAHYVDSDSQWVADDGQDWNVERLIQEELSQPIVGAACGGTHRLMGFAHALRRRRAEGKPITGQWDRADQYVNDFIEYTWQLQNRDGSMSTAWFEAPEDNGKIDRKLQTTGHMLEFLLTAVSDDQLQSARMLRTVNFLATTLYEERGHEWQVGPKGHALRALAMYYRRVFGRPDPWRPVAVARHSNHRTR
jgi:hypothetical protein